MNRQSFEKGERPWIPSAMIFFTLGFIYYLITPYFTLKTFNQAPLVLAAEKFISLSYFNFYYWFDLFVIYFFFAAGYWLGKKKSKKSIVFFDKVSTFNLAPKFIWLFLFFFSLFIFIKIKLIGMSFFSGYDTYNISILGPMATLAFTSAFFFNFFSGRLVKILFLILFLMSSIALLGFGSRMFFLLGLMAIALGVLSKKPYLFKKKRLYLSVISVFCLIVAVGAWRSGYKIDDKIILLSIFLIEPLFTATSGSLYIGNVGGRPFFAFPVDLIASIVNFVPSFIFPEKLKIINELTFNNNKSSPFGANSLIVNLYSNFGLFYPVYIIFIGIFYGFLREKSNSSIFFRAVYFSLLPVLMFHFFREGFITFIKITFFNGFILPAIILSLLCLVFSKTKSYRAKKGLNNR